MKPSKKAKAPNKLERERWEAFHNVGCIACYMEGYPFRPFTRHHLVEGYRMGHRFSIPLCDWHHQGYPERNMNATDMEAIYGPSMALNKKQFVETFGTERFLCEKVDQLLGYDPTPWPESKVIGNK